MGVTSEIFLTENNISKEKWEEFINTISTFCTTFEKWELIITNENNQIRFFLNSKKSFPATLNNMSAFLIKKTDSIIIPNSTTTLPTFYDISSNLIKLIDYLEIKKGSTLKIVRIKFRKIAKNKTKSKIYIYYEKNNILYKSKLFLNFPATILSFNIKESQRFFYKGVPKYLDISKNIHLLNTNSTTALLNVDTFPYIQGNFYFNENSYDFAKHSIIFGASGSGKSKFISTLINNIYKNPNLKSQYKIVIIDPHAALADDIGGLGNVIDFKDEETSTNLFVNDKNDVVATTENLMDLFKSLLKDQYNSKLERVLRHSTYLLLETNSFNFRNLRKLLLDIEFRSNIIKENEETLPDSVTNFFLMDFNDLKTKSYGEAISPIIGFIDELQMLPFFNNINYSTDLKDEIKNNFLNIFSLDRTKLGDKITKTIAGLVMQQLLTLIESHTYEEHIIFIIDEVAVVENPILCRFLSEARKYNLSLILAGQYFNQITPELKDSIFANVINYYIFRVSRLDATLLIDNFNMKIPLDDNKENKIKLLTELNNRECICRISSNGILLPAMKAKTVNFTSIPQTQNHKPRFFNQKNNERQTNKTQFTINNNINLSDILIKNSTNRKVEKL